MTNVLKNDQAGWSITMGDLMAGSHRNIISVIQKNDNMTDNCTSPETIHVSSLNFTLLLRVLRSIYMFSHYNDGKMKLENKPYY